MEEPLAKSINNSMIGIQRLNFIYPPRRSSFAAFPLAMSSSLHR